MTIQQFLFLVLAAVTLISAVVVVTNRNLFHAALALMVSFVGVAGFYITLDAGFLAAAQLLVYIGAISILIIFAIMMTRRLMQAVEPPVNSQWGLSIVTSVLLMMILSAVIAAYWPLEPSATVPLASMPVVDPAILNSSVETLGKAFVSGDAYVLPFEIASVLLLAALVGAILVAWPKAEDAS